MTRPIVQSVTFKGSPEELFAMFTDSKKHSASTGEKASVSAKPGAKWTAFKGMILGRNLVVVPGRMIVQAWRASHWHETDLDSVLIVNFSKTTGGGRIDLTHVGVPQHDHKGVTQGMVEVLLGAVEGIFEAARQRRGKVNVKFRLRRPSMLTSASRRP